MMNTEAPRPVSLHVTIPDWEYGCCGTVPAEGGLLRLALTAYPSGAADPFPPPPILDWDREMGLLRFAACSARWDERRGDPRTQPIRVAASWHESEPMVPTVDAEIVTVYQATARYRLIGNTITRLAGTGEATRVRAVERYPDNGVSFADLPEVAEARMFDGAIIGLAVRSATEPSTDDLMAHRIAVERAGRTVRLTGPAAVFGPTVPATGERITVDLGDPRLDKDGAPADRTDVVRGTTGQVSEVYPIGLHGRVFGDAPAGTPAAELPVPLFVVLVIDAG